MKKKYLAGLLLAVLCAVCLVWVNIPGADLLENDPPEHEDPSGSAVTDIGDNSPPLTELPGDTSKAPASEDPTSEDSSGEDPFAQFTEDQLAAMNEVLDLVNAARTDAGLDALELDPTLCGAAQVRAAECVGSFSHTRPNGTRYNTAITEAGLTATYTGENVATGYTTAKQVVDAWMKSEGHKANILNEHYTTLGVGLEANTGNRYRGFAWAQLFTSDFK